MTLRCAALVAAVFAHACAASQGSSQPRVAPASSTAQAVGAGLDALGADAVTERRDDDAAGPAVDGEPRATTDRDIAHEEALTVLPVPPPPGVLGARDGVVFASRAGGTVRLVRMGAPPIELRDGERVTLGDVPIDNASVGAGDTVAHVLARGSHWGFVANTSLLYEPQLTRASDGRHVVHFAIDGCGDVCHGRATLFAPEHRRVILLDVHGAGPEATVSFAPDASAVAVGSQRLAVCALRGPRAYAIEPVDGVTSPAYGPDGTLYVRGLGRDDAVYTLRGHGPPQRWFAFRGRPPPEDDGSYVAEQWPPVTFDADGTIRAQFLRWRVMRTVHLRRDGRVLAHD